LIDWVGRGPMNNRLDFGGDPDSVPDPDCFTILYLLSKFL